MNNNREAERAELHKTIWRIANDLRGSVDGWDFKTYVLGMLFYRFISENLTSYLNEQESKTGSTDFDYATLSDEDAEFGREETVKEKGFYILPSELFANMRKQARLDANLNETLSRVFADIEGSATGSESENDIKGLFGDLDVNSSKLGPTVAKRNEKLVKLLDAFVARKDIDHFARLVSNGDIAENGCNIAVSSYVEQRDTSEAVDIKALNAEIARIVARQAELRTQIDAIVADLEGVQA